MNDLIIIEEKIFTLICLTVSCGATSSSCFSPVKVVTFTFMVSTDSNQQCIKYNYTSQVKLQTDFQWTTSDQVNCYWSNGYKDKTTGSHAKQYESNHGVGSGQVCLPLVSFRFFTISKTVISIRNDGQKIFLGIIKMKILDW